MQTLLAVQNVASPIKSQSTNRPTTAVDVPAVHVTGLLVRELINPGRVGSSQLKGL